MRKWTKQPTSTFECEWGKAPVRWDVNVEPVKIKFTSEGNFKFGMRLAIFGAIAAAVLFLQAWTADMYDMSYIIYFVAGWGLICYVVARMPATVSVSPEGLWANAPGVIRVKMSNFSPEKRIPVYATCAVELARTGSTWVDLYEVKIRGAVRERHIVAPPSPRLLVMRILAEALSKVSGLPLLDTTHDPPVVLDSVDLDLPFRERVKLYPTYLKGKPVGTRTYGIDIENPAEKATSFTWHYFPTFPQLAVTYLLLLAVVLYFVPIGPFYDNYGISGCIFVLSMNIAAVASLTTIKFRLLMHPKACAVHRLLLGIPVWETTLPTDTIEEVRVIHDKVQLVSDRKILALRTYLSDDLNHANAYWLANELQQYLITNF